MFAPRSPKARMMKETRVSSSSGSLGARVARNALLALGGPVLLGMALAGCSEASDSEASDEPVGVSQAAITSETARIRALLEAGAEGDPGFLLKRVGGPLLENFNEALPYDPASSIKIVVGVSLLRRIDAGASFNLGTPVTHFFELSGSCPLGSGGSESRTLGSLAGSDARVFRQRSDADPHRLPRRVFGHQYDGPKHRDDGHEHGRLPRLPHLQHDHTGRRRPSLRRSRERHPVIG